MPKRYTIELTISDKQTGTQVEPPSTFEETYKDDAEAKTKFQQKVTAARNAGKGTG